METIFKKLTADHIPEVMALGAAEPGFSVGEAPSFWSRLQLERWFASDTDICLGAFSGDELVGFTLAAVHVPTGKVTWENLLVRRDLRGTGIGDRLVAAMVEEVHRRKLPQLCFYVEAGKERQHRYHERQGFVPCGEFTWFSLPPQDER